MSRNSKKTSEMEVHHPKHSVKPREKKEYLFEFLVIFVAITGGFFADNLRENLIDRHKEKEYMVSLSEDLKIDSASLGGIIILNKQQIAGLDSLLYIMKNKPSGNTLKQFQTFDMNYTLNYNGFSPAVRTISQLMNTGGLTLVRVKMVSDGIVGYNNFLNTVQKQAGLLETRYEKLMDLQTEIIDLQEIMKFRQESPSSPVRKYPELLTSNKKTLHAYYFHVTIFKGALYSYTQRLETLKEESSSLIKLIQKEYKLKN